MMHRSANIGKLIPIHTHFRAPLNARFYHHGMTLIFENIHCNIFDTAVSNSTPAQEIHF